MTAEDLRKAILQQAIQGKLVPQNPDDEPASILLERIREEKARLVKEKKIKKNKNESIIYRGKDNSHYEKILSTGEIKCIDDEVPFEIPNTWEWCRLGEIFQHNTGKALNGSNTSGQLRKYLTTSNVYWDSFDLTVIKEMYFKDEELDKCSIKKGDLLVCEGGDIGRAAIWNKDESLCIQNHIHRLRGYLPISTKYFYYIFWLFKRNGIIGGKGIGIQGLSSNTLHNILLPIPPITEQYKIVEKIELLIEEINKYEIKKIELDQLESELQPLLKKSILQYAIQGKLVPQIENEESASVLLEKIQQEKQKLVKEGKLKKKDLVESRIFKGEDNKYYEQIGNEVNCIDEEIPFEIPESWRWSTIGDLLQIQTGASFKKEEVNKSNVGVRILRGGNIISGSYVFKDDDIFINKDLVNESILLRKNDLITPSVTSIENVGKIARIIEDYDSVSAGGFVFIFRPFLQNDIISQYLCFVIQTPVIIDKIKSITKKSGSAFYNIGKERLSKIYIPLPPIEEQRRIVEKITKINKGIESI